MSDIEIYTTIKDYNKYLINSLNNIKFIGNDLELYNYTVNKNKKI